MGSSSSAGEAAGVRSRAIGALDLTEKKAVQPEYRRQYDPRDGAFAGPDIEIVHRRSLNEEAEQLTINVRAMPSFEAFGRLFETANPFALWTQTAQIAWYPWLNAACSLMLPRSVASAQVWGQRNPIQV